MAIGHEVWQGYGEIAVSYKNNSLL